MDNDKHQAVAQIVSALLAKNFDKDTDGLDVAFEDDAVVLIDTSGHRMSLRGLISHVRSCLE